jgi:hypothetical protein
MSPASTKPSMLAVAGPTLLRTTVLAGANYTRQHANLLVPGQIISVLVIFLVFAKLDGCQVGLTNCSSCS